MLRGCSPRPPAFAQESDEIVVTGEGLEAPPRRRRLCRRHHRSRAADRYRQRADRGRAARCGGNRPVPAASDSRSAHPTSQGITLRGPGRATPPARALLLLDGVPQADPFGGWVAFSRLSARAAGVGARRARRRQRLCRPGARSPARSS
ncbi:MAG: hypothetical protein WDN24_05300 [Sphingomonas sp.]